MYTLGLSILWSKAVPEPCPKKVSIDTPPSISFFTESDLLICIGAVELFANVKTFPPKELSSIVASYLERKLDRNCCSFKSAPPAKCKIFFIHGSGVVFPSNSTSLSKYT